MKDNIETIKAPDFTHRTFNSPVLRKLMKVTSKRFINLNKEDRLISIIASSSILILGIILVGFNRLYSFLLFFIETEQTFINFSLQILMSLTFVVNFIAFFIIIEGILRIFFKKKENTFNFLISVPIIQSPMVFYLIIHSIFNLFQLLSLSIFRLLDNIFLIVFQVWSLWLLSYSLCVIKELKIESGLIISLLLHYGTFMIILFISI